MSLSTLTQCHPKICRIHREHDSIILLREPPPLNWKRIDQVSMIAAMATTLSQVVSTPVDVGMRVVRAAIPGSGVNMWSALTRAVQHNGLGAAFEGLPWHLLKRVPTKALTVAFFEAGTQLMTSPSPTFTPSLNSVQHLSVATCSGVFALLLTYPVHMIYYAQRKKATFAQIVSRASETPGILYKGAVPAVLGTAPAVTVDYAVYRKLRGRIDDSGRHRVMPAWSVTSLMIVAAAASNLLGGFMSEPFKAVSRKMAAEAVRSTGCQSIRDTANIMLQGGVGEFWRGFPLRSVRYAVSAVVSKTTVQHLKSRSASEQHNHDANDSSMIYTQAIEKSATARFVPPQMVAAHRVSRSKLLRT